jgi:hypothetical protein
MHILVTGAGRLSAVMQPTPLPLRSSGVADACRWAYEKEM